MGTMDACVPLAGRSWMDALQAEARRRATAGRARALAGVLSSRTGDALAYKHPHRNAMALVHGPARQAAVALLASSLGSGAVVPPSVRFAEGSAVARLSMLEDDSTGTGNDHNVNYDRMGVCWDGRTP